MGVRSNLEKQLHSQRCEYEKAHEQLQKMQSSASQFATLERELKCKEHEPLGSAQGTAKERTEVSAVGGPDQSQRAPQRRAVHPGASQRF